jgi:hypothetical protein
MTATIEIQEKPILFSGEMVRALLDGRKTQTRRVMKLPTGAAVPSEWDFCALNGYSNAVFSAPVSAPNQRMYTEVTNRYGDKGDRLWTKETHYRWGHWTKNGKTDKGVQRWKFIALDKRVVFAATDSSKESPTHRGDDGWWKRPAIFMPRWASRFNLEITEVRVQRVQEITEEDAIADGVVAMEGNFKGCFTIPGTTALSGRTAREWYSRLWDKINLKRGFGWDKNPWVLAISFRRAGA